MGFKILKWSALAESLGMSVLGMDDYEIKEALGEHLEKHPEITGEQVRAVLMTAPEPPEEDLSESQRTMAQWMREIAKEPIKH